MSGPGARAAAPGAAEPGAAEPGAPERSGPLSGRRILLPRLKDGDALAAALRAAGADVETVQVTRTVAGPSEPRARAGAALAAGAYAWLIVLALIHI